LIVAPLTKEDAREIYFIVGALDGLAAWHAAGLPEEVRSELVQEMVQTNEAIQTLGASPNKDFQRLLDLHGDFHDLPLAAVAAPRLAALHAATKPQADRYRRIYSSGDYGQQARSVAEHKTIIDAIAAGNRESSLCSTQEHWMAASDRLCRIIEAVGERGSW
jgi:DNA-binding GntR family transcriptional regulator